MNKDELYAAINAETADTVKNLTNVLRENIGSGMSAEVASGYFKAGLDRALFARSLAWAVVSATAI